MHLGTPREQTGQMKDQAIRKLPQFTVEYSEYLRSLKYSPETVRKTRQVLLAFCRWLKANYYIETADRLHGEHLKKWHLYRTGINTREGRPLKGSTLNRHITTVRGLLRYMAGLGYVRKTLYEALPYVKEARLLPGSVLTHAQVKKLLKKISTSSAAGYRDRTMLELLYTSGIRAGEMLALNVDDIDFKNTTMIVTGKGNKQRMVPIGRTALRYLESYIVAVRPYLIRDRHEKALFLNENHDGKRLSYQVFRRIVLACAARAGLDVHVTAHTFRRSCTTELLRSGANMYHVKELLGHESLDTLKHYARLTINDLKATHQKCHPREKDG